MDKAHTEALASKHAALHAVIDAEEHRPHPDVDLLTRLKKEKLRLKDELVGRGRLYYAKLSRGKAMFLAPRMIPYFHAIRDVRRSGESTQLSRDARALLRVLRQLRR